MQRTRRGIILLIVLTGLVSGAAAVGTPYGPIQDVTVIDGIDGTVTAGDTDLVTMAFRNSAEQALPLYVAVTASSEQGIDGDEFTIEVRVHSDNGVETRDTELSCTFVEQQSETAGMYLCSAGRPVLPGMTHPSENTVHTTITSALHTMPGDYWFDVELYSTLGIPKGSLKKRKTAPYNLTQFPFTNVSVTLNTSTATTAAAEPLHDVIVPSPADTTLVNGVAIEAPETTVGSNSRIRFQYPATVKADSLTVYRFDTVIGAWRPVGSVQSNATVTAQINHTGVYGLFGSPADEDETEDDRNDEQDEDQNTDGGRGSDTSAGSSSSSTGIYHAPVCTTDDWSCAEWSACTNGTQTRQCEKTRVCTAADGYEPQESRECTESEDILRVPNGTEDRNDSKEENSEDGEEQHRQSSMSGITGQISSDGAVGAAIITVVIAVVGVLSLRWERQ
jgi:hypothetical protein